MNIYAENNDLIIEKITDFDIGQTLECGQCFHFEKISDNEYGIAACGRLLHIKQIGDSLILYNTTVEEFDVIWKNYFDLDRDYGAIKSYLLGGDEKLKEAVETMHGVRILNQEFEETLISFIISQNKQIPHIKQIVAHISREYGEYLGEIEGHEFYSFPNLEKMYQITEEQLRECKTGFRAPYIRNAIELLYAGTINTELLGTLGIEECREQLKQIKGVGNKVANCVMLFGLGRREAFPVDVWIKRIMEAVYFDGKDTANDKIEAFATERFGELGGYAQQYLFYYGKTLKVGVKEKAVKGKLVKEKSVKEKECKENKKKQTVAKS